MILKNEAGKLSALSQDTGTPWMANTKHQQILTMETHQTKFHKLDLTNGYLSIEKLLQITF